MTLIRSDWENSGQGLFIDTSTGNIALVGPDGSTQIFNATDSTLTIANHALALSQTLAAANAAGPSVLNEAATATNPTVNANKADPDTGLAWAAADALALVAGGVEAIRCTESGSAITTKLVGTIGGSNAASWGLLDEAATATNPTVLPDKSDADTGLGNGGAADKISVIVGGVEAARWTETASAIACALTGTVSGTDSTSYSLLDEACTQTNPTLVPDQSDVDTGLGHGAADELCLVAGGKQMASMLEDADASHANFFGYHCISETFGYADMTDGGAAVGTYDLTIDIPDGAVVQRTIITALTGFTGDSSATCTIGDGADVDRYNTGTPNVFVTNASGVDCGAVSGTAWHDAAKTPKVTITTAADFTSVSAGQMTVSIFYYGPAPS